MVVRLTMELDSQGDSMMKGYELVSGDDEWRGSALLKGAIPAARSNEKHATGVIHVPAGATRLALAELS